MNKAEKFRLTAVLIGVLLPLSALSDSRVVPEDVLSGWGYETTHLEKQQTIRQIEPLPDKEERWHPRFDLWSECLDSNDAALQHMTTKEAEIEAERAHEPSDQREHESETHLDPERELKEGAPS